MNTLENNKLIAEFMNLSKQLHLYENPISGKYTEHLKYNTSWNWLMEVVEKIESTEINNIRYIDFHIMPDAVIVSNQEDEENPLILINKSECKGSIEKDFIMFETRIQAVYNACVEFIKWYNEHK